MASLKHEHKIFIVKGFAAFQSPSELANAVNEEFRLNVTRQQVWKYHPDNPQTAPKWKEMYTAFRDAFIKGTTEIAISHKSFRLSELEDMRRKAKKMRNFPLAAQLLEQAAKEMGGLFTNRRRLDVNPREALAKLLGCTPDELPGPEDKGWLN
jgi:hypothetical protein